MGKQKIERTPGIAAYVRVSTGEQATSGLGLEAQRAAIQAEAARRNLPVLDWYADEGVSARSLKRPELARAREDLKAGRGSVLMASKVDRLSRSVHDASSLMNESMKQGWALVLLDAPIDSTSPAGLAMLQVLMVFAQLERGLIGARTREALAAKKAQGYTLGRRRIVSEQVVDQIVRAHDEGMTWSGIARMLNEAGVSSPLGGIWHPASVRLTGIRQHQASLTR